MQCQSSPEIWDVQVRQLALIIKNKKMQINEKENLLDALRQAAQ